MAKRKAPTQITYTPRVDEAAFIKSAVGRTVNYYPQGSKGGPIEVRVVGMRGTLAVLEEIENAS